METAYASFSRTSSAFYRKEEAAIWSHARSKVLLHGCQAAQLFETNGLWRASCSNGRSVVHKASSSLAPGWGRSVSDQSKAKKVLVQEFLGTSLKHDTPQKRRGGCRRRCQQQLAVENRHSMNLGERPPIWGIHLVEGLAVGICPQSTEDAEWVVKELGVDAMLCLEDDAGFTQLGWEWEAMRQCMEALGCVALRVPMRESDRADQAVALPEAVRVLGVLLGSGRRVYVCSASDGNRASLAAVGYLTLVRGTPRDRALEMLRSVHNDANPPLDSLDDVRARVLAEHGGGVMEMARKVYETRMQTGQPGGPEQDWREAEDYVVTRVFQDAVESRLALVNTLSRASVGALSKKIEEEWMGLRLQAEGEEAPEGGDAEAEDNPALAILERIRRQVEAATADAADARARTEDMAKRAAKLEEEVRKLRRQLREAKGGSVPDVGVSPAVPSLDSSWDPSLDSSFGGSSLSVEPEYLPSFIPGGGEGLFTGGQELEGGEPAGGAAQAPPPPLHPKVNGVEVYDAGTMPSMDWSGQVLDLPAPDADDFSLEALVNEGIALGGKRPPRLDAAGVDGSAELAGGSAELASGGEPQVPSVENDEIVFRLRAEARKAAEDYEEAKRRADRLAEEVEAAHRFVELIKQQAASNGLTPPPLVESLKETEIESANGIEAPPPQLESLPTAEAPPPVAIPVEEHSLAAVEGAKGEAPTDEEPPANGSAASITMDDISDGPIHMETVEAGDKSSGEGEEEGGLGKGLQLASVGFGLGLGLLVSAVALQLRMGSDVGLETAMVETLPDNTEVVSELRDKVSDLEESLARATEESALAGAKLESLQAEVREALEARGSLEARLADDAQMAEQVQAELAVLRADQERIVQEKAALESQLAEATKEEKQVRARLGEMEKAVEALREERDSLTKKLEAQTVETTMLSSEVAELKRAAQTLQQERLSLGKKAEDSARVRQELEEVRVRLVDEVQNGGRLRAEAEAMRRRLSEEKRNEARLLEEVAEVKRKGAETEARMTKELEGARREVREIKGEKELLERKLKEVEIAPVMVESSSYQGEMENAPLLGGGGSEDDVEDVEGPGIEEGEIRVAGGPAPPARRRFI